MKKILLSTVVVLAFIAYAIHQQTESEGSTVIPPSSLNSQQNTTSQPTQSSSNAGSSTPPITQAPQTNTTSGQYKDGEYTGPSTDAFYGNVQVKVTVSGGKISDVQFLDYPSDRRTSQEINSQAMPYLKSEAIQAQSADVQIVSGATQTSQAFQQSLKAALDQAHS